MNKEKEKFLTLAIVAVLVLASIPIAAAKRNNANQAALAAQAEALMEAATVSSNWGLSFQQQGKTPVGNATSDYLAKYDSYFCGDPSSNNIYLTFDAGYENGHTEAILDALKKHGVKATFFLVGNYIEKNPELVKRMVSEGHSIGNHTYHHPDMGSITTEEAFRDELESLEKLCYDTTGVEMSKFYRPPQGKYSEDNLKMAQQMGYKTIFWSLAYVDWYVDDQPSAQQAYDKLLTRIHPGAIVLLHSTSATNAEIMEELLTKWEEMGYTFGTLEELTGADGAS